MMPRRTPRTAWTIAALMMGALAAPVVSPGAAATERVLEITTDSANPKEPFKAFDGNPTKLFDIDGDGDMEIIAQNDNQWVYVFDSRDGDLLAEVKSRLPSGWGARSFNGPEVSILTDGGSVRMVVANSAAVITMYRFDQAGSSSNHFNFIKEWDRRLTGCDDNPAMDGKPVLADLDNDGAIEIVAATETIGVFALRRDGSQLWQRCIGGGNGEPAIADLNQDGVRDVIFASDGGTVTAMHGTTGSTLWSYWIKSDFNLGSGAVPVMPGVGQLDGRDGPDVVVGARDSHNPDDWDDNHALLLALDSHGNVLWGRQHPEANPLTYTRPAVVDADGDGVNEVYWGDWNTNGHKPPHEEEDQWQRLGPANFYRYSNTGGLVWRQSLDTFWSNKDIAVADVDGDGVQEVLANGPMANGHDAIWELDSRDGHKENAIDLWPYKAMRQPVVEDVWGEATTQWVIQVAPYGSGSDHGILLYDAGVPFDAAWPHVPYVSHDRGGAAPPPSGETFDATFTIHNPNEWWQQVDIDPDTPRTIGRVQVRVDEGPWHDMTLQSYGHWTSSRHSPAGSRVEFLATDGGATSQSEPFTWLDGTDTRRSTDDRGSDGEEFSASFEPSDNVNEWWVEVFVNANQPLEGVDARVNAGAWTALSLRDWGAWAKSMHAPAGSQVEFRATATDGSQTTSDSFTWLEGDGGGGEFTATFDPRAQGNDWWVEVHVSSSDPITGVEAQVNSGSWTALSKTDWGTWAKSIHAPDGSRVTFRATNDAGETATSQTYTW